MDKTFFEVTMGRSLVGTLGGAAAVVLAILGLLGLYPSFLIPIATIAVGASLLFKGATIAAEYPKLISRSSGGSVELAGGLSVEFLAGAAGIVLGILSLLGLNSLALNHIAIIVFGCGLVAGSSVLSRLNALKIRATGAEEHTQSVMEEMVSAATGIQVLVGLGAIVLGILALTGILPTTLTLVALLAIGGTSLLSGSTLIGRMMGMVR